MKKLMSTIAIIALIAGTGIAQEGPRGDHGPKDRTHVREGKGRDMMADIPDLTEAQKKSLQEIKKSGKEGAKSQREAVKAVRNKLADLKTSTNPNINEINSLIDEMHKLEAEMDKSRMAAFLKMRSVLTAEQLKVFDAKQAEKRAEREKRKKENMQIREAK